MESKEDIKRTRDIGLQVDEKNSISITVICSFTILQILDNSLYISRRVVQGSLDSDGLGPVSWWVGAEQAADEEQAWAFV